MAYIIGFLIGFVTCAACVAGLCLYEEMYGDDE